MNDDDGGVMKKWNFIVAVLICGLLYAIVRLSVSEYRAISEGPDARIQAGDVQSTKQVDANGTEKAAPDDELGTPASAADAEAIIKAFSELQSALKSEDYERARELTSESFKGRVSFEELKQAAPLLTNATAHPESAVNIDGRVRVRVTVPSHEESGHLYFIQEDGKWKLHDG